MNKSNGVSQSVCHLNSKYLNNYETHEKKKHSDRVKKCFMLYMFYRNHHLCERGTLTTESIREKGKQSIGVTYIFPFP